MGSSDMAMPKNLLRNDAIHDYILDTYVLPKEHAMLKRIREETFEHCVKQGDAKMAMMGVPPEEAQLLSIMLKLMNAKKTIELGVFTGYSLLATALALPKDAKITAIDIDRSAYEVGLPFIEEAGVADKINFIESAAIPVLDKMIQEASFKGDEDLFDFAFVDADKPSYGKYHDRLAELVKVGGLIAYDNTLWFGSVANPEENFPLPIKQHIGTVIEFNKKLAADSRFEISQVSVGDGVTICRRIR